ncbi:uncharacterized protein Z518_01810 [Rhinocladiella mackenziei CBS 650.93]|uniref:U3 small nucleolar RNA-associated protein 22 n=1 Tax=Rhinocladiella mackenziei CBS 650.93 TaxID=1442369 RepID=A0A0D2FXY5_9EURO|nr:uncharacterized protein Z518_01810 [Rhinocladiella mackenziei CBS 650.93]KIX07157.1 hypothetical protein Z518_01810 [Rhinocladiella mackenziei CBS 650.93]
MSIKGIMPEDRSSKRRKLSHGMDNDDFDILENSISADDTPEASQEVNEIISPPKNQPSRTGPKPKRISAANPTVLPTGGISKSAVLALQVADLVAEATPNYARLQPKWTKFSNQLVAIITQIPEHSPATAVDALKSFRKQGIQIPFPPPQPSKDTNYKFEFKPPKQVMVGGPLPWELSLQGEKRIEITAVMPEDILQEKDYLNNRAFHKAAFYLACIAATIKEGEGDNFDLAFAQLFDVDLLPIIEIVPREEPLAGFKFKIGVGFPGQSIPMAKTLPNKNCLRQGMSGDSTPSDQPTPFYNSCLRYAASIPIVDDIIQSTKSPAFNDACRLGQLWLRQRGFSSSTRFGGFGFLEWSLTCALLLRGGGHRDHPLFSKQYSGLQLFKAMLQVLAGRDLRDPMVLNGSSLDIPRSELPVLFDGKTGVNILYKMSPWSYQSLRHYAQVSLAAVNSRNHDSFDSTFILNVSTPLLEYDELFTVSVPTGIFNTAAEQRQLLHQMHRTLVRGLGDRVTLIVFKLPQQESWSFNHYPSLSEAHFEFVISLLINPETVARLVDHGPSADQPEEAAEFQKFWGEKAELRRFKDGSISESLVWASGTPVTLQIISHLTMRHFKLPPGSIQRQEWDFISDILEEDISVSAKDGFRIVNSAFQTLSSTLHSLEGLPLPIRSISPAGPALRSSSTGHPLRPPTTSPIDILIQFDTSTRWPDSLPAIQHTKIAFLLKLADLLTASNSDLNTRVGLENTDSAKEGYFNTSFLDIIYPSPAPGLSSICFRARIHHDREVHLLQTALADKSLHGAVRDTLTTALAADKRDFLAQPTHTTAIRNLSTRFPPLSNTIRLLKKWVSSHLLLAHIPEEILEMVAAHIFLHPSPWSIPGSSTTAFLRCLHLLSRWDWAFTALIIDLSLSQDMSASQVSEIETRFQAWRKLDPNMNNVVWLVGTNLDTTGTVWTQGSRPPRVVAGRLAALARAAVQVIETQGSKMDDSDWRRLFISPLSDFDFLIHIKPSVLRSYRPRSKSKSKSDKINGGSEFKNLQIHDALDSASIGYDPVVSFLRDLKTAFGSAALFFHETSGGSVVAGLWKPSVLGKKEWRIRLGWSSVPVSAEKGRREKDEDEDQGERKDMCVLNKDGMLAEIAMLGDGIVKEITVKA